MNTRFKEKESQLLELAEKLERQRYRLAVVLGNISSGKTKVIQRLSEQLQASYFSLASDLLSETVREGFSPTLGAFGPDDLIEHILTVANRADIKHIIFDQTEPLMATFGRAGAITFFRMLSQVEPLSPVIFVTYLGKQIEEANFPKERIWQL
jgi:AAA+ ATPase superfamily predicted ATPase